MNSKASFVPFYACGARTAASAPATSPAGELACVEPERGVSVARPCWPRRPGCQRDSSASTPLDSSPPAKDLAVQVSVCQLPGMRTASDLVVQSLLVPVVGKRKLASSYPKPAVDVREPRPFHRTAEDGELLPKSDIVESQLATSLEGGDESANKRRNQAGMVPADRRLIKFGAPG